MYEEKLSPNNKHRPNAREKEISTDSGISINHDAEIKVDSDDVTSRNDKGLKDDAVLDEVAAKVNEMGLSDADNSHEKCMDTVKSQEETINTLINQLRIMFEEYTSINNEREYYEELNEALFRCLELKEGAAVVDSDSESESTNGDEKGKTISTQTDENSSMATDKDISTTQLRSQEAVSQHNTNDDEDTPVANTTEAETRPKQKAVMKKKDLLNINELLLREISEMRHEMEVLKEGFRDYLNSEDLSQESEFDTDTDDEEEHMHECSQCRRSKSGEGGLDDSGQSEDYQYLENDQVEIADESDSD